MAAEVSSEYAVQMHGITKRFGSFYALTDVQLDVKKGTIHSILGENGAGKSTLIGRDLHQWEKGGYQKSDRRDRERHRHGAPALYAGR